MWSRLRQLLMCLLIAALPVQGWAAATMLNCGPTHHRMAAAAIEAAAGDEHSHHHGMSAHEHAAHGHEHEHEQKHEPDGAGHDEPLPLGKFNCSACALCCLGVALPSPIVTFDASVSSEAIAGAKPPAHAVFLTAGPERPPRSFLA